MKRITDLQKKIGILTFHYAHNFGAVLQAYALKTYLLKCGYDIEIINYRNAKIERRYSEKLSPWFVTRYRDWILPWRWKNVLRSWKYSKIAMDDWKKQYKNFSEFEYKYLVNEKAVSGAEIRKRCYSALIYGSDQIWDLGITGKKEVVYWGKAAPPFCKNISYGASIYTKELTVREKENVKKYLGKFHLLSVRESSLAFQIETLLGKKVETVSDPTLLLSAEEYLKLIKAREEKKEQIKPYTLIYLVSESKEPIKIAEKIGLPIKVLRYYTSFPKNMKVFEISDAGPIEFLDLLYRAEYVITNSFHGVVFSILFQKKFCAVYNQNVRIENLLKITGMRQAHRRNAEGFLKEELQEIDERNLNDLEVYINKSKEYLHRALGEKSKK